MNDIETEIANSLAENDKFYDVLSKIAVYLKKVLSLQGSTSFVHSSLIFTCSETPEILANLPKITSFDGSPLRWQSFWDQFQAPVDSKENIQKVVKFNYLTGLLNKNVKFNFCFKGLNVKNKNYDIAVKSFK